MRIAGRASRRLSANPPVGLFKRVDKVERNRCSRLRQLVPHRAVHAVLRPLAKDDPAARTARNARRVPLIRSIRSRIPRSFRNRGNTLFPPCGSGLRRRMTSIRWACLWPRHIRRTASNRDGESPRGGLWLRNACMRRCSSACRQPTECAFPSRGPHVARQETALLARLRVSPCSTGRNRLSALACGILGDAAGSPGGSCWEPGRPCRRTAGTVPEAPSNHRSFGCCRYPISQRSTESARARMFSDPTR